MMKKFYILSFMLVFLISTTGLPLTLHLCAMQESASLATCEMCASKPVEIQTCCSDNADESQIYFSKAANTCCETQLIDKKIKDDFCPKTELTYLYFSPVIFVTLTDISPDHTNQITFISDSPPLLPGSGRIFIDISLLLI